MLTGPIYKIGAIQKLFAYNYFTLINALTFFQS